MTGQGAAMLVAGGAVTVVVASLADRARLRRRDLDRVGFMPWRGLALLGLVALVLGVALLTGGR